MIRVEDAEEALGYWVRKFDYDETRRWESNTFANYFVEPANASDEAMSVELTYNYDGRTHRRTGGVISVCASTISRTTGRR